MGDPKRIKLDKELRDALPPELYRELKSSMVHKSSDFECGICLEDRCKNPTELSCGHFFCLKCLAIHMQTSIKCPTCVAPTTKVIVRAKNTPTYRGCHPSEEPVPKEVMKERTAFTEMHHILREGHLAYEPKLPKCCQPVVFERVGKATFLDDVFRRTILQKKKAVIELRRQKEAIIEAEKTKRADYLNLVHTYMA